MSDPSPAQFDPPARERRLMTQLSTAPIVQLAGVVSAAGAGGVHSSGDPLWTLRFELEPWRFIGGAVRPERLTIHRELPREELSHFTDSLRPYGVFRFEARFLAESAMEGPQALLVEVLGPDSDPELVRHSEKLQEPVTIEDRNFGTLTLDRRVDWYVARTSWNSSPVELCLHTNDPATLDDVLLIAHALWHDQTEWDRRVRDYAVAELLSLKNESWREEDEPIVTAEEFRSRMTIEVVTVRADGSFEFWHNDGDLFFDHSILIGGSLATGPRRADIAG